MDMSQIRKGGNYQKSEKITKNKPEGGEYNMQDSIEGYYGNNGSIITNDAYGGNGIDNGYGFANNPDNATAENYENSGSVGNNGRGQDFFGGEYDETTNNPNKTYKNTYWIGITKNNQKIPNNLRDRFWTHIQGGFLTEQDEKTNYNVKAIGDIDYPQKHFGRINEGIDESNNEFIGDISEYNSAELLERMLEPVYHRINTVYREYRKEILNLSNTEEKLNEKKYDVYFNNNQIKIFNHNFNTERIAVNFYSNTSKTSMDNWDTVKYSIIDSNRISVEYSKPNSNNGHSILTTISNLSSNKEDGFNDDSYEVGNLKEGYIYNPHHKIKIREFDSIISVEEEDISIEIPNYATLESTRSEVGYSNTRSNQPEPVTKLYNTYRYRRLLDVGETDILGIGVDYPFNSGAHYLYLDAKFYLQRQDPPFDESVEQVEIKLPNDLDLLNYLVKSPNYVTFKVDSDGFTSSSKESSLGISEVIDGDTTPIKLSVLLKNYTGKYSLGDRYIKAKGLFINPSVKTKIIDDVC